MAITYNDPLYPFGRACRCEARYSGLPVAYLGAQKGFGPMEGTGHEEIWMPGDPISLCGIHNKEFQKGRSLQIKRPTQVNAEIVRKS